MSKLTLSVDKDIVEAAKKEAARRGTSVSKLVSDYLEVISSKPSARVREEDLPPATRELSGILDGVDYDPEARLKYLIEKHS